MKFLNREEQTTAVVESQATTPATWLDIEPGELRRGMQQRSENRKSLIDWVRGALIEGTDYGRIHFVKKTKCPKLNNYEKCDIEAHYSKATLWKPGAEKISGMLGLRVEWPNLMEELASLKTGARFVALRCVLLNQTGDVVSEGIGARSLEQDYNDVNKTLKMAKKSGHIDAVLSAAGLSEVFTQDVAPEVEDDRSDGDGSLLSSEDVLFLEGLSCDLFGPDGYKVLENLALRRFKLEDSDYRRIPAYRFNDAVRSLKQKKEEQEK